MTNLTHELFIRSIVISMDSMSTLKPLCNIAFSSKWGLFLNKNAIKFFQKALFKMKIYSRAEHFCKNEAIKLFLGEF